MRNTTLPELPTHPLIRDPRTGEPLRAVGIVGGRPVWPIMGASDPVPGGGQPPAAPPAPPTATPPGAPAPTGTPPATPPATPAPPAAGATPTPNDPGDQPLGPAGQRALEREREQNAELRRQLAAATAGQTDQERTQAALTQMQQDLQTERRERLRLAAANGHGIPASHLDLLTATDEAGLEAQATKIAALLAAATPSGGTPPAGGTPLAPLPGQGTPPAPPATTTVAAGRSLYQERHPRKSTT